MKDQIKIRETHNATIDGLPLVVDVDHKTGITTARGNVEIFLIQNEFGEWDERENVGVIGDEETNTLTQLPEFKTKIKNEITIFDETIRGKKKVAKVI